MNDYILNITLAKGSGEYCISHILAPFAHARWPMVDRISALKIPIVFVCKYIRTNEYYALLTTS